MQQQLRSAPALKTCVPRQHNVKPHNSVLVPQVVENIFSVRALQYGALARQLQKLFTLKRIEKHHTTSCRKSITPQVTSILYLDFVRLIRSI